MAETLLRGPVPSAPTTQVGSIGEAKAELGRTMRAPSPALVFAVYLAAAWGVIGWIAASLAPAKTAWAIVLACAVYTTAPMVRFAALRGYGSYPSALFRLAVVRPVLYTQLLLPVVAGAGAFGLTVGSLFGHAMRGGQVASIVALIASVAFMVFGWMGSRRVMVRDVEAHVPDLPAAFDGLRVVQVSDMHLGPQTSLRFLKRVSAAIAELSPDVVTVTGDLVDDQAEDTRFFARWLERMTDEAKPEFGVYLIPGNHDIYAGWGQVAYALREYTRAHVLVNESRTIARNGASLALVGVGDPSARGRGMLDARGAAPDLRRAFARVSKFTPAVVFAHNPSLWPSIAEHGAALTLSGHTHWGQFALPRIGWSLASPFLEHAMGAFQRGKSLLYVHPGTGFWGIPFRVGALPEVARVTLRRAATSSITVGEARLAA